MVMLKRVLLIALLAGLASAASACTNSPAVRSGIITDFSSYLELSDGTWKCGDRIYKYRLEITGRMPNAAKDITYVYLSNIADISFDQAMKASGISSDSNDYFKPEDAVLVEMEIPE